MVITRLTRNQLAVQAVRGFESHHLRHLLLGSSFFYKGKIEIFGLYCVVKNLLRGSVRFSTIPTRKFFTPCLNANLSILKNCYKKFFFNLSEEFM